MFELCFCPYSSALACHMRTSHMDVQAPHASIASDLLSKHPEWLIIMLSFPLHEQ